MTARDAGGSAASDPRRSVSGADPDPDGALAGSVGHERLVQEGLDHLQGAARETIAALRALLDLAEDLVDDPRAAEALFGTIGSFAQAAVRSGGQVNRAPSASSAGAPEDDDDGGRVQRIPVS